MTNRELAELALRVLDAQARYFKSRDQIDLVASKLLESKLRTESRAILSQQMKLLSVFGGRSEN